MNACVSAALVLVETGVPGRSFLMVERREHPRHPLARDVHCYIDGVRFDARTLDISAGGSFVRTTRSRSVTPGALVGLVFPSHPLVLQTTFLFGRVTRIQAQPVEGLALCWEKAVTVAPPEDLAKFLKTLFGIESPEILKEVTGNRGQSRNVYRFPPPSGRFAASDRRKSSGSRRRPGDAQAVSKPAEEAPAAGDLPLEPVEMLLGSVPGALPEALAEAPAGVPGEGAAGAMPPSSDLQPAGAGPAAGTVSDLFDIEVVGTSGLAVTVEDLDALELKVIALETDGLRRKPDEPRESPPEASADESRTPARAPGQISVMVAREDVQVSLPALLALGSDSLSTTVRRLGAARAFVQTGFVPADHAAGMQLRFEIPTRRGPIAITCQCRLEEVVEDSPGWGSGMVLRFQSMDEGGRPGVLERYMKFVQFQDLARS